MDECVEIYFDYVETQTEQAILVSISDDDVLWIPKSLIANLDSFEDDGYLELPVWFAEQEGLV